MALPSPPRRPSSLYGGMEERTPLPQTVAERLTRVETKVERHDRELHGAAEELHAVAHELRAVAESNRTLMERKKFHDKLILAAATLLVTGLIAVLARISWWVQSARMP